MQKSKVTILMPVYNGALYLREAMDSILAQTYSNFTLLIINDGSTDNTQTIINSYKDTRIQCIQQENQGVARSLNNGLTLVDTIYVRRHDADDYSDPCMLQAQLEFLEQHPEIQFVSTQCAFMTDRSKVAHQFRQPKTHILKNRKYLVVSKKLFNPYSPIVHGTVLGPSKIFKEMGGYRTEFLTSEDNDLWLRIIEKYKFVVLNSCSYYLRINATSATKVHKVSVGYYRNLAIAYATERATKGSDPIMRGEQIPKPAKKKIKPIVSYSKGKHFRGDLIGWDLRLMLNAKDFKNSVRCIKIIVQDGWKLKQTYKGILIAFLGVSITSRLIRFKNR